MSSHVNLATIQKIQGIRVHSNSDNLELADVLAWQVVVKKGEFRPGDLVVYICTDTVLPAENPNFQFLASKKYRINPIRLRGEASAGICFPLSILPADRQYNEADDVTELIGVKHYEKPVPAELSGKVAGSFPGYLKKTDEDNLRSYPELLNEFTGRDCYITLKMDGSSGTWFIGTDGQFGVCSRNLQLEESDTNGFWKMAKKYDLKNKLLQYFEGKSIALQGEVCGPGIQHNKIGLPELQMYAFTLYNPTDRKYLGYDALVDFCTKMDVPMVPLIRLTSTFNLTIPELVEIANTLKYPNGTPAEGMVLRPKISVFSKTINTELSAKIMNENYS